MVIILAAGITTLLPQTNDVSVSEETKPLDPPNEVDSATTTESQQEDFASPRPTEHVNLTPKLNLYVFLMT